MSPPPADALPSPRRRALLAAACTGTLAAPPFVRAAAAAGSPHDALVAIDVRLPGTLANRRILGSNVQWVDGGDDLLGPDDRFDAGMLAQVKALGPTVLRYPGGAQSDAYHWERGMGPMATRGENEHVNARKPQRTRFGTREFLELCEATGAEPLITANVQTGTPDEAARWLRACNVDGLVSSITGRRLPRVPWWELGNEPYLTNERPDLALEPREFARHADRVAAALREVDPSISIGVPVVSDTVNGIPVTHRLGFTREVLGTMRERLDYVCAHDAYLPHLGRTLPDRRTVIGATMGATRTLQADLASLRRLVASLRPPGAAPLPIAITEYHAMYTLGGGASDDLVASPLAALYVADALRVFATTPDVLLATQWSLTANWRFGLVHGRRFPRAAYRAVAVMGEALRGRVLPASVRVDTMATPSAGRVAPVAALPLVEALAARDGDVLRVVLIHKDPERRARVSLALAGARAGDARWRAWACEDLMESRDDRDPWRLTEESRAAGAPLAFEMAPGSLALLTLGLKDA